MIVKENIEFKRGQESKSALDVGVNRSGTQIIKKHLEPTLTMFYEDSYDWINKCPPLKKELRIETADDIMDLVSLETEYTVDRYDLDIDELEDNFYPIENEKTYKPSGLGNATWRWNMGELPDGSKIIHYEVGMVDGYIARKEWIK